ncbi:hypothetical protein [Devosia sp.]|uniref:hypothetical protein n=1 Tax=Devosia sp. TaxID=1871048 RepID=UPI001AC2AAA6|nr:hypothetical protein [Devosia sp.]MBN9310671.1 hypothetical protein [Devosia sp.]
MQKIVTYEGEIEKITLDGRSAVVRLDDWVEGVDLAVISPDTIGRLKLMNGKGVLEAGRRVSGDAKRGPDALKAITVHAAD